MSKTPLQIKFQVGDEVSYAMHNGMLYGEVVKIISPGENGAIEIEYEDGRHEVKKVHDRALRLVRRKSGASEIDELHKDRPRYKDSEIDEVRRSDIRRSRS